MGHDSYQVRRCPSRSGPRGRPITAGPALACPGSSYPSSPSWCPLLCPDGRSREEIVASAEPRSSSHPGGRPGSHGGDAASAHGVSLPVAPACARMGGNSPGHHSGRHVRPDHGPVCGKGTCARRRLRKPGCGSGRGTIRGAHPIARSAPRDRGGGRRDCRGRPAQSAWVQLGYRAGLHQRRRGAQPSDPARVARSGSARDVRA